MTREEKITGLYNLKEYLVENPIEFERHKSLPITLIDYAIEALEQEPSNDMVSHEVFDEYGNYKYPSDFVLTEPNTATSMPYGDVISRQAVLDKKELVELEDGQSFYCISPENVETLPPVTPQPKTGYWILQPSNKEQGEKDFIWWKCSECGQVIYSETEKDRREFHAFCGRCGARMDKPQERSGE